MEFRLKRGSGVFKIDDESLRDEIRFAYEMWRTDFEKRPGMNADGLLRKSMEKNEHLTWGYDNGFGLDELMKTVLNGLMVNHKSVARFFEAEKLGKKTSIVLKYANGEPMKLADIAFLKWYSEGGAFDRIDDLEDELEEDLKEELGDDF